MREEIKKHICKWRMPKRVVIRLKNVQVGSQNDGMVQKKGRPLGRKREESREKREDRGNHDQYERVEGRNGSVPEGRYGIEKGRPLGVKREESRKKREERREKRSQKRPPEIPKLIDSRVCWPLGRLESLHFYRVGGLEAS